MFAAGALLGLRFSPYGWLFRRTVLPRVESPTEREPVAPPRFAQGVGLVFAVISTVGYLAGAGLPVLGIAATAVALAAAFLNAAFGLCLGCETYLVLARLGLRRSASAVSTSAAAK